MTAVRPAPTGTPLKTALAPVRAALLDRARADAAAALAAADTDAAAVLAEAREQAAALLREAREQGEREAAALRTREHARAGREARSVVLGAQRTALDELRRRTRVAARALRDDRALLDRLRARLVTDLGPDAVVREHPDGGLVADAPGRRVDASLPALADRALDGLGGEVQALWTP
jgi:hypothetical protein